MKPPHRISWNQRVVNRLTSAGFLPFAIAAIFMFVFAVLWLVTSPWSTGVQS